LALDGTYGRLGSHNHRVKDLRRRRKDKGGHLFLNPIKVQKVEFDHIDPNKLRQIKLEIQRKKKKEDRKDLLAFVISFLIGAGITLFFLNILAM